LHSVSRTKRATPALHPDFVRLGDTRAGLSVNAVPWETMPVYKAQPL